MKAYSYSEPDPGQESYDYLTELLVQTTVLPEEKCRMIARALLSFADVLVHDD